MHWSLKRCQVVRKHLTFFICLLINTKRKHVLHIQRKSVRNLLISCFIRHSIQLSTFTKVFFDFLYWSLEHLCCFTLSFLRFYWSFHYITFHWLHLFEVFILLLGLFHIDTFNHLEVAHMLLCFHLSWLQSQSLLFSNHRFEQIFLYWTSSFVFLHNRRSRFESILHQDSPDQLRCHHILGLFSQQILN